MWSIVRLGSGTGGFGRFFVFEFGPSLPFLPVQNRTFRAQGPCHRVGTRSTPNPSRRRDTDDPVDTGEEVSCP